MDAPAVANRAFLFMQLPVLLRRSSLMEGATTTTAKLNQPDGMAGRPFLRRRGLLRGSRTVFAVATHAARQLKQHTG